MILNKKKLCVVFFCVFASGDKNIKTHKNDFLNETLKDNGFENRRRLALKSNLELPLSSMLDKLLSNTIYLKQVEKIDFKLKSLDLEMHEQGDVIIKNLIEVYTTMEKYSNQEYLDDLASSSKNMTSFIQQVLNTVKNSRKTKSSYGLVGRKNNKMEDKIIFLEDNIRHLLNNVNTVISNVADLKVRKSSYATPQMSNFMILINDIKDQWYETAKNCDRYCRDENEVYQMRSSQYPSDCFDIQMSGFNVTGVYKIKPHDDLSPFSVLCDHTSSGGGWTVIQNRFDGSQNFNKNWSDYSHGFGNLAGEFWMGLEKLHYMTNYKLNKLRVELKTISGREYYTEYSIFAIGAEYDGYRISMLGSPYGTAGDSLLYHAGQKFSTIDVDNDDWIDGSCAQEHLGGWWYKECIQSNLNGLHVNGGTQDDSIFWISLKNSDSPVVVTRMMIRPVIVNQLMSKS